MRTYREGATTPGRSESSTRVGAATAFTGGLWRPIVIGALALFFGIGLLGAVWVLARPLGLLLAAIVLAQAVAPAVSRVAHWLPRPAAILAVYTAGLLIIGAIAWLVTARLATQLVEAVARAPSLIERTLDAIGPPGRAVSEAAVSSLLAGFSETGPILSEMPILALNAAFETLLVIAVSIYWLHASRRLVRFVLSFVPPSRRAEACHLLRELAETMGGYVRARVLVALISGSFVYVGLLVIGIDYALALALVAAVGKLVPLIGAWAAAAPLLAVALLTASPWQVVAALLVYAAIQSAATYVLLPRLTSQQAAIPPVLVLLALLAGGSAAGFLGVLLAIPLAGAIRVLLLRLVAPAVRRWVGAYDQSRAQPGLAPADAAQR